MREVVSENELYESVKLENDPFRDYRVKNLHGNLALPSYVHGYSLGIEYMYNWFKSKFPKDFFKGGIYVDGKNVLDDYKRINEYAQKNIIKGQNPRARMAPTVEYDYDRDSIDLYTAPPEIYLKRSQFQDAFFKDYDNNLFLGFQYRMMKMDVNYKVRLNSRSQQLDTYNRMELYFRNGATQYDYVSVDFHVPKYIIINIAERVGFDIKDGEVLDIISFLSYLNQHSELPFLFKLRAINQKPEFFIRVRDLYTHISTKDKLQLDDGERDGKLDFNFHIEMQASLLMPIPHFYAYYSPEAIGEEIEVRETPEGCVAIYSINPLEFDKTDEHGWNIGAITDYQAEKGDEEIDIGPIFTGNNGLTLAVNHDLTNGLSPSKFINIKIYRDEDIARRVRFEMDWANKKIIFKENIIDDEMMHIVIYYDRDYINELEASLNNYNKSRFNN